MMTDTLLFIGLLACCNAVVVLFLCDARITIPIRRGLADHGFLGSLLACPFCTSIWTSMAIVLLLAQPRGIASFTLYWLATAGMTSLWYKAARTAYS